MYIIQWAMTDKEALEQYSLLFERLVKVGMQLKPSKCIFFARENNKNWDIVSTKKVEHQ